MKDKRLSQENRTSPSVLTASTKPQRGASIMLERMSETYLSCCADAPFWQHPGHLVFLPAVPARFKPVRYAAMQNGSASAPTKTPTETEEDAPENQPGARERNPSVVQLLEQPTIYRGSSLWCAPKGSVLINICCCCSVLFQCSVACVIAVQALKLFLFLFRVLCFLAKHALGRQAYTALS